MKQLQTLAEELLSDLRRWRRDFHQWPELGFQEKRTAAKAAEILRKFGWQVRTGVGRTGVIGLLKGRRPGPTVALRADMDALQMQETSRVPYRSRQPGVMHACGHDGHVAMLLGAACLLKRMPPEKGAVKLIFQPAEELIEGAAAMIADGAMQNPRVNAVFGLHLRPDLPTGMLALRTGVLMAASRHFVIRIIGRGGHGARPDRTVDPLPAAHALYGAIQTIRRGLSPLEPCVISVCAFRGGETVNIIPQEVELRGTIRTCSLCAQKSVCRTLRAMTQGIAQAFRVRGMLEFQGDAPVLDNAAAETEIMRRAARQIGLKVKETEQLMASEDFACYQQKAPGAFAFLGAQPGRQPVNWHTPDFDFNERALAQGAALFAACARVYLMEPCPPLPGRRTR